MATKSHEKMQREVFKWIQGLDLTYALKNPQRDAANGFLVAEILNRYHPDLISMLSFDRGISKTAREGNWLLLGRIFDKLHLNLPRRLEPAIQRCESGVADHYLTALYSALTKKPIPNQTNPSFSPQPHFSTPTASLLAKDPSLAAIVDDEERQFRTFQTIAASKAPRRRSTRLLPVPAVAPVKQSEAATPAVQVRHVQVKALTFEDLHPKKPLIRKSTENQSFAQDVQTDSKDGLRAIDDKETVHYDEDAERPSPANLTGIVPVSAIEFLAKNSLCSIPLNHGETITQLYLNGAIKANEAAEIFERVAGSESIVSEIAEISRSAPAEFWNIWQSLWLPLLEESTQLDTSVISASLNLLSLVLSAVPQGQAALGLVSDVVLTRRGELILRSPGVGEKMKNALLGAFQDEQGRGRERRMLEGLLEN